MSLLRKFLLFLSPSIFQGLLSFVMLPVITYILGPKDYGIFALVTSFTAFGTVIATMGTSYILAAQYHLIDDLQKQRMISTMLMIDTVLSLLFSILLFTLWSFFARYWSSLSVVPKEGVILSLIAMVCSIPWIIATEVVTLEGSAHLYAVLTVFQSIVSAITIIFSLYVFKLGLLSLFVSSLAVAVVSFVGAMVSLRQHIRFIISRDWVGEIFKFGLVTTVGNIFESLQTLVERYTLSLCVGLSQLGIYSHSQQYRNLAMTTVKAAARTVWPITLSEARELKDNFYITRKTWVIVYIGITIIGLFFALFGRDIIGILTHNKFVDAQILVVLWMVFLLLQNTGKPETGLLFANGQGILYGKISICSLLISIFLILVFVPVFGVFGAVLSLLFQQAIFRVFIQFYAKKIYKKTVFSDWGVIIGSVLILFSLGLSRYFQHTKLDGLIFFSIMVTVTILIKRNLKFSTGLKSRGSVSSEAE